jgi:hypothetical protein
MKTLLLATCVALPIAAAAAAPLSPNCEGNDYPTAARADYVFACMQVNGGSQEALQKCSCSIDVIASIMPYDTYEKADTVLRMRRLAGGYLAEEFRTAPANSIVDTLQEAQAEAEVRCF